MKTEAFLENICTFPLTSYCYMDDSIYILYCGQALGSVSMDKLNDYYLNNRHSVGLVMDLKDWLKIEMLMIEYTATRLGDR